MANPQSNLDELMKDPKAAGLLKNKALLQSLMQSPDTQRLMELLDIRNKEEQSIGITDTHIREIKEYLSALELIVNCPIETADPRSKTCGTHPVYPAGDAILSGTGSCPLADEGRDLFQLSANWRRPRLRAGSSKKYGDGCWRILSCWKP